MTFTYDASQLDDPTNGPMFQVRFQIGDTVETSKHIEDQEIEHLLIKNSNNVTLAAVDAADYIAMRYAHEASFSSGAWREDLSARSQNFKKIADSLRKRKAGGVPKILKRFTREQDKASGRL